MLAATALLAAAALAAMGNSSTSEPVTCPPGDLSCSYCVWQLSSIVPFAAAGALRQARVGPL